MNKTVKTIITITLLTLMFICAGLLETGRIEQLGL